MCEEIDEQYGILIGQIRTRKTIKFDKLKESFLTDLDLVRVSPYRLAAKIMPHPRGLIHDRNRSHAQLVLKSLAQTEASIHVELGVAIVRTEAPAQHESRRTTANPHTYSRARLSMTLITEPTEPLWRINQSAQIRLTGKALLLKSGT